MGAPCRLDRDSGKAIGAILGRRFLGRRLLLPLHLVHAFDQEEHGKGDNQEADDGIEKGSIAQRDRACLLGRRQGKVGACGGSFLEGDKEVREINVSQE